MKNSSGIKLYGPGMNIYVLPDKREHISVLNLNDYP